MTGVADISVGSWRRGFAAYTLATGIAVPVLMHWVDLPLATFFHRYDGTGWEHFFAVITNLANGAIWYSLAAAGMAVAVVRRRFLAALEPAAFQAQIRAWLFMIVVMASSGIAEILIKVIVGRDRPQFFLEEGHAAFHPLRWDIAHASFPSGHAQSITAAMLALSLLYPPLRGAYFGVAALVAASRVVIDAHYASDVAAGTWLAVAAIVWFRRRFERGGVSLDLRRTAAKAFSGEVGTGSPM